MPHKRDNGMNVRSRNGSRARRARPLWTRDNSRRPRVYERSEPLSAQRGRAQWEQFKLAPHVVVRGLTEKSTGMEANHEITRILVDWDRDPKAALERLTPLVYH